jgi:hypothetical protein
MAQETKTKESVLDHYEIVGVLPGEVYFKGETIHLGIITLEKAHQLNAMGFPYLKPKTKPVAKVS